MPFTNSWDETKPDGTTQRGFELDDEVRVAKAGIRERLEGDPAAPDLTGLIEVGSFTTAPKPRKGTARVYVDTDANILAFGVTKREDGRLAVASDTRRLYHVATAGVVEVLAEPEAHTHAETDIVDGAILARVASAETISGLYTFSHASGLLTDVIGERTAAAGVTVDGLLIKDGGIPQAAVTAHQAALSIAETQITDGAVFPRLGAAETITGLYTFAHASGLLTDLIGERTAAAGVTVDGVLLRDGGVTISQGAITSGTYTPTLTAVANVASATPQACQWLRVGNVVTVSGLATVDPTATGTTVLGISLPIASAFTASRECAGAGTFSGASFDDPAQIRADSVNDRAQAQWQASTDTSNTLFFTFTYLIV